MILWISFYDGFCDWSLDPSKDGGNEGLYADSEEDYGIVYVGY